MRACNAYATLLDGSKPKFMTCHWVETVLCSIEPVQVLCMQAQFLDRHHLLIALRTQDPEMARNMDMAPHPVFYVVYDTASSTIRKVTDKNDAGVVHAYLQLAPMFHAADITSEWGRFVTPAVIGLQPPEEQMGLASRQWNGIIPVKHSQLLLFDRLKMLTIVLLTETIWIVSCVPM